jgi:nucleotide-binding universal stress UspA family protein
MRKILLTTDGSENAIKSASYVADLYGEETDLEVTIFSIYPAVPPLYREESLNPGIRKQSAAWLKKREEDAHRFIEASARILQKKGLKRGQIRPKQTQQVVGVARDVIREMDAQKYEAAVIGKKGMSWFDDFFLGSITSKLLEISEDHPLWVVEGKGFASRKVLIAMDETEHALYLARYAGRMLQGIEGVEILFYYFCAPFTEVLAPGEREGIRGVEKQFLAGQKEKMSHWFEKGQKILLDLGFEKKSITSRFDYDSSARPQKVSQGVFNELHKGNFGTLIVGRKGATRAREFRLGSVALRIVAEAQNCAVWVV